MGKRKHGEPDRFQWGGFEIDERPTEDAGAVASVKRFVDTFVIATKRERIQAGLLHRTRERRTETIQSVYKWIEPKAMTVLEGNTGFPQHLHERFGNLRGVLIDEHRACHVTVAGAAVLSAGQFGAMFIADAKPLAVILAEDGPPTLCLEKTA